MQNALYGTSKYLDKNLTRRCLAICKNRPVESFHRFFHNRSSYLFIDFLSSRVRIINIVLKKKKHTKLDQLAITFKMRTISLLSKRANWINKAWINKHYCSCNVTVGRIEKYTDQRSRVWRHNYQQYDTNNEVPFFNFFLQRATNNNARAFLYRLLSFSFSDLIQNYRVYTRDLKKKTKKISFFIASELTKRISDIGKQWIDTFDGVVVDSPLSR